MYLSPIMMVLSAVTSGWSRPTLRKTCLDGFPHTTGSRPHARAIGADTDPVPVGMNQR